MTSLGTLVAPGTAPPLVSRSRVGRIDATSWLTAVAVLTLLIPSTLVIGPLGAVGTPAEALGVVLLALWALSRLTAGVWSGRGRQPIRTAALVLALAVVASYATGMVLGFVSPVGIKPPLGAPLGGIATPSPLRAFLPTEVSAADRGLIACAAWLGVALFAADGISTRRRLDTFLGRLVALGAVVAAIGALQFFTAVDLSHYITVPGLKVNGAFGFVVQRGGFGRAASTATDPIEFGVVMAALFPIGLMRALHAPRGRRLLRWLPTLMIFAAIPMSVSRSAVVVLVIEMAVIFLGWQARQRLRMLAASPLLLVGLHFAAPHLIGTLTGLFTHISTDPSASARLARYPMAFHVISTSPLTGRGLYTFIAGYYTPMDNQALLTAIEMGALGVGALLALFAIGYFTARGARLAAVDAASRDMAQALAASLLGVFASYLTFDALTFPMCALVTFLLIGCAGAMWRIERSESRDAPHAALRAGAPG